MSVDNDTENELLVAARNGDTRAILEIQNLRTVINEKGTLFCLLLIVEVIIQFLSSNWLKKAMYIILQARVKHLKAGPLFT